MKTYGHIQKIVGENKRKEAIKRARCWKKKTYAGNEYPEPVNTVPDLLEKGKISEMFIRYGKTLVAKVDSTTWYETETW